jgi:hypothetical protein
MILLKHMDVLMQIKSLQGAEIAITSSHYLEDWSDLLLYLLSSPLLYHEAHSNLSKTTLARGGRGMAECLVLSTNS